MIIGLTGFAGSGKTTVARHLVTGHGFTLVKFAGPLKGMLRALALNDREIEGDLKEVPSEKLNGRSPREAMQLLGTEWGRKYFGEDFWVKLGITTANGIVKFGGKAVLDDCRFPNEAEAIRQAGGYVIRIARQGVGPINAHASDNQEIWPDWVIPNDYSIEELIEMTDGLMDLISRKAGAA